MRTLFAFFRKYYFFFLFLSLEGICIILISNHNPYHRTHIINSSNSFTGGINSIYAFVDEYFGLKKNNNILYQENAELRNVLNNYKNIPDTLINEYYSEDSSFIFIPAKVIYNSVNKRSNYIMLNKGRKQGIDVDMGVVSSRGIVGVVVEVSNNYCTILSLLHKDSRISAKIKKNNHLANLIWPGNDYREAMLQDVPTHLKLYKGDTIITSGYSFMFPEGIILGYVKIYRQGNENNFNEATIELTEDFNGLRFVYIIKNTNKEELEEMIINTDNEQ
ncbi:rod shape-determining protein MreC [Bacteroidota bacterium]